jgi:cell division control protein 6
MSIEFLPYTAGQVSDILETRCAEAFAPKAVGSDVIDKVATITTSEQVKGDVRYALDLMLYAGNLAETEGTGRVTLDQVRKVHGQIHPSLTTEDIEQLSKPQILSLVALTRALKARKKPYVDLREIRQYAEELATQFGIKKFEIENHLDDLHTRKLVDVRSLKEIGLHGASLSELEPILLERIKAEK